MSDWELEYDEKGGAISKLSPVHTAPYTQWKAIPKNSKNVCFDGKRGGKLNQDGPQWRNWRARDDSNRDRERLASSRPLTLTLENSLIGRVIGKLALWKRE